MFDSRKIRFCSLDFSFPSRNISRIHHVINCMNYKHGCWPDVRVIHDVQFLLLVPPASPRWLFMSCKNVLIVLNQTFPGRLYDTHTPVQSISRQIEFHWHHPTRHGQEQKHYNSMKISPSVGGGCWVSMHSGLSGKSVPKVNTFIPSSLGLELSHMEMTHFDQYLSHKQLDIKAHIDKI